MLHRLLLLAATGTLCAVEVAPLFTNHAVLQRDKPVPVWGKGATGEAVTVRFAGQEKSTAVGADGSWTVTLDPVTATKDGRDLVVVGTNTITLKDVVVGEVWICSGQSNMEWRLSGTLNAKDVIAAADLPTIRHIKIQNVHRATPASDAKGTWAMASPKTAGDFSAVGFYFARTVAETLDVPVGLIGSNWGGTRIEPWISPAGFHLVSELKALADQVDAWDPTTVIGSAAHLAFLEQLKVWIPEAEAAATARQPVPPMPAAPASKPDQQQPTRLWNGMIHPLVPYAIRGALWYQGESNGGEGVSYLHKKQALIGSWRQAFGQGDFPFYFVQLANYQQSDATKPQGGDGWSRLREAQTKTLAAVPNTGMAVTIDIGEANDIHPRNKQDVGQRLALWALAKDYGQDVVYSGPLYREHVVEGATIRVHFDHVGGGLMVGEKKGMEPTAAVSDGTLTWWAIAGEDKVWYAGEARIDGDSVVVSSPAVANPVAVRYAFAHNPAGANLYNRAGLPASPFRTDTW